MSERERVLLRPRIVLVPHPDPRAAAYGITHGVWKPRDGALLKLQVAARPGKTVDAELIWRVRVGQTRLPNGNTVTLEDVCLAQVCGATDVESAISAVEQAAVVAGWARVK